MAPIVEAGQQLCIPLYNAEEAASSKVEWQQDLAPRSAQYISLMAINVNTGEDVPFFIASEYYKPLNAANPNHISKFAEKTDDGYLIKVDDRFQYGQKNKEGEQRWVVYHDKSRRPFQHRFLQTALPSLVAKKGQDALGKFLPGGAAQGVDAVLNQLKGFVGDYLHTF